MPFTEANVENAIIELFQEQLGYHYTYGPDVTRDYTQPLYMDLLHSSLYNINPTLSQVAIEETINKITTFEGGTLVQKNARFHDFLQNGVDVNYFNGKEMQSTQV